jgi:predicted aspartyl protease
LTASLGAVGAYQTAGALEVPFALTHNEIVVTLKVNGQGPYQFLLDTDTDPSTVDLTVARAIHLPLKALGGQISGGGTEKREIFATSLKTLDISALQARDVEAIALDLSGLSTRLGVPVAGVLGHSFLGGRIVQLDYPNRTVRFFGTSPIPPAARGATGRLTLPFTYDDSASALMIDDATVNGRKVRAAIDTGSDGSFDLTPAAVVDLGLEATAAAGDLEVSTGYRGAAEHRKGRVETITVGTIAMSRPEVVFFLKGAGRDREPWSLNIGNAFLKDYVVTIDYRKKLITFDKP